MRLLAFREHSIIDYQTMDAYVGHERLFRAAEDRFILYMSSKDHNAEERVVWLSTRDAFVWLNQVPDQYGFFGIAPRMIVLSGLDGPFECVRTARWHLLSNRGSLGVKAFFLTAR